MFLFRLASKCVIVRMCIFFCFESISKFCFANSDSEPSEVYKSFWFFFCTMFKIVATSENWQRYTELSKDFFILSITLPRKTSCHKTFIRLT